MSVRKGKLILVNCVKSALGRLPSLINFAPKIDDVLPKSKYGVLKYNRIH